jgi:hypothetical protein
MKKIYAFFCFLCLSVFVSAQTYLSEDFSGGMMPPTGWSIDGQNAQWGIAGSNVAGGTAPEAKFTYIQTISSTRLISPAVDLTGLTTVTLMFNHFYDDYSGGGPVAGVATRSGGGAWTSVWEINPTSNVGPETIVLNISNSDVGHSDFQICFYLDGNLYNIDYWYLDDIVLLTPLSLDAALTSISLPSYVEVGENVYLSGSVKNLGTTPVTSFDIVYRVDGGAGQFFTVSGVNVTMGQSIAFTHNIPLVFNTSGTYSVVVDVQNVNLGTDLNPANDTLDAYVSAVPWVPVKKVFAEEATGTWCGWCVRGICFMDYMAETYPDTWIGAAVHNGDPMVNTAWDDALPNIIPNFPGYPSGTIDRAGSDYWDPQDFEQGYLQRITAISPASVGIVNFTWDPGTRVVSFDVQSEFIVDVYNDLRFAAVILEDSVWGTSSQYAQANYYSGGGQGPMCGFESKPDPIPAADMHYDHVGREILDGPYGTPGSLPSPIPSGSIQSHFYTYTIPSSWVFEKLQFVGLLMDNTTGEILNANNVVTWLGENELTRSIGLKVFPNPFSSIANVTFSLEQPQDVSVRMLDMLGRPAYKAKTRHYPAGDNTIKLDGSSLENGLYIVELTIGKETYTKKVSINK